MRKKKPVCEHEWVDYKCTKCGQFATDDDFSLISDNTWELGSLSEIKEKLSPELFTLHIGINITGNFQCDGWHNIFMYQGRLLPHTEAVLDELGLQEIKNSFSKIITRFPKFASDEFTCDNCDELKFLYGAYWELPEEELRKYSEEERTKIADYNRLIEELDNISDKYFGYDTPYDGWESVIVYIKKLHNTD